MGEYIEILENQDKQERTIFSRPTTEMEIMIALNKKIEELELRLSKLEEKR